MAARRMVVLLIVAVVIALCAHPAQAVVCGKKEPRTGEPVIGGLTLAKEDSKVALAFGRDTESENLGMYFTVTGCPLPDGPDPRLALLPASGADHQLKEDDVGNVTFDRSSASTFVVVIPVVPGNFKPGSYGALAQVTAPYLTPSRTLVGASRSESKMGIPLIIGALGALIGLALTVWTKANDGSAVALKYRSPSFLFLVLVALGAGAIAGWGVYRDQDIWRMSENWLITGAAGLTAATTGTVLAMVAVFAQQKRTKPAGRASSASAAGQPSARGASGRGGASTASQPSAGTRPTDGTR